MFPMNYTLIKILPFKMTNVSENDLLNLLVSQFSLVNIHTRLFIMSAGVVGTFNNPIA